MFPIKSLAFVRVYRLSRPSLRRLRRLLIVTLFAFTQLTSNHHLMAQCTPAAPATASCSGGNGAATNGANINSGQIFWYSGGPATFSSGVNLSGGTLRVCGILTLSSINFNSGQLIIESGGQLTINGSGDLYLNGNASIVNRGTLTINRNLRLQNSNNTVWNDVIGSNLTVTGTFELNSATSKFLNRGTATINRLHIQSSASAGAVCLQASSCTNCSNLVNSFTNGISFAGSGSQAALSITAGAELNQNVTSSSSVVACVASGATISGGAGWGSATQRANCASCNVVLPVSLLYFRGVARDAGVYLEWETSAELNNHHFTVERAAEGGVFRQVVVVPAGKGSGKKLYSFRDEAYDPSMPFYRLKQTDIDGTASYSRIIQVNGSDHHFVVRPTVVTGTFTTLSFHLHEPQAARWAIFTGSGQVIALGQKNFPAGNHSVRLDLQGAPPGTAFLRGSCGDKAMFKKLLIRR